MRPVRLPPCAAGASPTISRRALSEPRLGTGLPQYSWSRKRRTFTRATSSRYTVNRGQSRQFWISSWARQLLFAKCPQNFEEDFGIVLHPAKQACSGSSCADLHVHGGVVGGSPRYLREGYRR